MADNPKISGMTAAVVANLAATTTQFEVATNVLVTPATRSITLGVLRDFLAAQATGFAAVAVTVLSLTLGAAGAATSIAGTATAGTDQAAGAVTIIANLSTGAGTPGSIVLQAGQILGTGTTVQTAANIATFRQGTTTAISEWVFGQATARIVGGSTNGLAIRNSGNTRDNFSVNDPGTQATLTDNTNGLVLNGAGASGEFLAGGNIAAFSANGSVYLFGTSAGTTSKTGFGYYDGTQKRVAAEVTNVASGFGTLALMKSGGVVNIGGHATKTSPLNIAGLPTSSAGLNTGDVYSNAGILTIV